MIKERNRKKRIGAIKALLACILMVTVTVGMTGCTRSEKGPEDSLTLPNGSVASGDVSEDAKREDTGSTEEDADEEAKGRYLETEMEMPPGTSDQGDVNIRRLSDNRLLLLDAGNCTMSISGDDGQSWDTQSVSGLERILGTEGVYICSAMTEDGDVFISYEPLKVKYFDADGKNPGKYIYFSISDPEKTMRKMELDIKDHTEYLCEATYSADGRLFAVSTTGNVYELDLEKESSRQLFAIEGSGRLDLCTNGDSLIVTDGRKVYFYDLESRKTEAEDEVLNAYVAKQDEKTFGIAMCMAKNGKDKRTLYLAGCNGIAGHVIGGSVMEQLVDGAVSSLGDPSKTVEEIIQNEDGSFLVLYETGELDVYAYDKDASAVPKEQIVVYGLYDNETVRQAISSFRKKDPEVVVRFQVGLSGDSGMTRSDAVKNLNTELLAGEGPDIILLDGMPMGSYIEKGMLEDMSGLAEDLTRSGDYFEGILNGFRTDDGTYALPFRYQIPMLAGEQAVLSKISDLKTLADGTERLADMQTTQETVLGNYSPEETLEKLCLTSANAWVTPEGEVDREALQEFLTQAERIYRADQKNLDEKETEAHRAYTDHIRGHYDERKAADVLLGIGRAFAQIQGTQVLTAGYLSTMSDLQMLASMKQELADQGMSFTYQIWNGQEEDLFCSTGTVGISAGSSHKELAEAFIRVLLGSAVQGRDFEDGFPVNAAAYETFAENPMRPGEIGVMGAEDREGKEVVLSMPWPKEQELEALKKLIGSLATPAVLDENLKNEVVAIGAQALRGEKGIEESVQEITQKLSLYYME